MIARGDELERLEDFRGHITANFPNAEILCTSETLGDEIKNKNGQSIQIFPVKPIMSENEHFCRNFEHLLSFLIKVQILFLS